MYIFLSILFGTQTKHSPEEAFQTAFPGSIPSSVTIYDFTHTSSFEREIISIHFTIAPQDLHHILESRHYEERSEGWGKCSHAQEVAGWKSYSFSVDVHRRYLCVSPKFDEVYCSAEDRFLG